MARFCPECGSSQIVQRGGEKKAGCGLLGSMAGAAVGSSGLLAGSETGAALGVVAGPAGMLVGGIAGAIIGGLLASTVGCGSSDAMAGSVTTGRYQCADCGHGFGG